MEKWPNRSAAVLWIKINQVIIGIIFSVNHQFNQHVRRKKDHPSMQAYMFIAHSCKKRDNTACCCYYAITPIIPLTASIMCGVTTSRVRARASPRRQLETKDLIRRD